MLIGVLIGLVVVTVVCTGSNNDHHLHEYRLAPKLFHRKIRSSLTEESANVSSSTTESTTELDIQIQPQLSDSINHFEFPTKDESVLSLPFSSPVGSSENNTSFLLDLPYPSHFLFSLQLLNLSLPFLGDDISIPDDPPTPEFKLSEVINNQQFLRPEGNEKIHETAKVGEGGRRVVNRVRNRIPSPPFRRLPKRSTESSTTTRKTLVFRSWNASNPGSAQRRLELYSKNRPTTTSRPKPIKKFQTKLLDRRANATKPFMKSQSSTQPLIEDSRSESTTPNPSDYHLTASDQLLVSSSNKEEDSEGKVSSLEPKKSGVVTLISGFRPGGRYGANTDSSSSSTEFNYVTSATTEVYLSHVGFPPPRGGTQKHNSLKQYISQFDNSDTNVESSESHSDTQIQKPLSSSEVEFNESPKHQVEDTIKDEFLTVSATSATTPAVSDFVFNFTFPSFELPTGNSSQSAPSTLPPPLSIEELIKKFTGSELIPDSPFSFQQDSHTTLSPSTTVPTYFATIHTTTSSPTTELDSLEKLETSLKQLLAVTTSTTPSSAAKPIVVIEAIKSSEGSSTFDHPVLPSPNIISTTQSTQFLLPAVSSSTTAAPDKNSLGSESVGAKSLSPTSPVPTTTTPGTLPDSLGSIAKLEAQNQSFSIQRGPLDVSTFDASNFGIGQNGFQQQHSFPQQSPFNFQSLGFQQQAQPYPDPSGGGSGGIGGFGLYGGSGQSYPGGFDGTLHYSPTGPPAGDFNAITQGLSLLASFGGGDSSGGNHQNQFFIQQPSHQQYQSFGDFNPAALQATHQSTVNIPSYAYSQGYPNLNVVQQHSQNPYQIPQSIYQQQQLYAPVQQQAFQLVGSPATGGYPIQQVPAGIIQQVPQQALVYQSIGPASTAVSSSQPSINPSQFGTLLTGVQSATSSLSDSPSISAGTASVTISSSSDAANTDTGVKSPDASASKIVEIHFNPSSTPASVEDSVSQSIIAIGPLVTSKGGFEHVKTLTKKPLYVKGLHSGYYS